MRDDKKYIRSGEVSSVLCDLCGRTATGMLRLENPRGLWKAGFDNGRLNVLSMPEAYINPLLGDLLADAGIINEVLLFEILQESQKRGSLYGRVLLDYGISHQVLWNILNAQARQRFFRFIRFAYGAFQFIPDIKPEGKNSLGRPLDPVEECRRIFFDETGNKAKIKTLQKDLDDFMIRTSSRWVPRHLLRFSWEYKVIEELHQRGPQKASWLLKKAPTRFLGVALIFFLRELDAIHIMNYPAKSVFFFGEDQINPSKRNMKSKTEPSWSFNTGYMSSNMSSNISSNMGSEIPYKTKQPRSQAEAEAEYKNVSYPSIFKTLHSIHDDKKDFEKTLKKWWRSMARRYHPDIHVDADPKVRRLFAQRFAAARETYLKCLKERALP